MSETLLQHAVTVYQAMSDKAATDGNGDRVWEGKLTELFREAGIPTGWYSRVTGQLYGNGCLEKLQVGSKYGPTRVKLLASPSEVTWKIIPRQDLTARSEAGKLGARLENVERQLRGIDIRSVLVDFETRLATQDKRVAELERLVNAKTSQ